MNLVARHKDTDRPSLCAYHCDTTDASVPVTTATARVLLLHSNNTSRQQCTNRRWSHNVSAQEHHTEE